MWTEFPAFWSIGGCVLKFGFHSKMLHVHLMVYTMEEFMMMNHNLQNHSKSFDVLLRSKFVSKIFWIFNAPEQFLAFLLVFGTQTRESGNL